MTSDDRAELKQRLWNAVADARSIVADAATSEVMSELWSSYYVDPYGEVYEISERGSIGRLRQREASEKRRETIRKRVEQLGRTIRGQR